MKNRFLRSLEVVWNRFGVAQMPNHVITCDVERKLYYVRKVRTMPNIKGPNILAERTRNQTELPKLENADY